MEIKSTLQESYLAELAAHTLVSFGHDVTPVHFARWHINQHRESLSSRMVQFTMKQSNTVTVTVLCVLCVLCVVAVTVTPTISAAFYAFYALGLGYWQD